MDAIHYGPEGFPPENRTLVWQILEWQLEYLQQPDGPDAGGPWRLTGEQLRLYAWWYAIDDTGRFVYRRGVLRRVKGWGKDPFGASVAMTEFVGPCRFGGWDANQMPVAIPHPAAWIQIAAVSMDQTRTTMVLFPGICSPRVIDEYGIDLGKTVIYSQRGGRIEAVTSSPRTLEGGRPSLVVANEALALDTPLPTPQGWTTAGAVQVGDHLIGDDGTPVCVSKVTPVYRGRDCYRVHFGDGGSLVADAGHWWVARVASNARNPWRRRTTAEMAHDGRRFAVAQSGCLDLPDADLPLDPYILGYWLGNGANYHAVLSVHASDAEEIFQYVVERGVPKAVLDWHTHAKSASIRMRHAPRSGPQDRSTSVQAALRRMGLLRNKHIPAVYLRASVAQRLDLLRGLMDSDGSIRTSGQARFSNANTRLIEGTYELLRSLGLRVARPYAQTREHIPECAHWQPLWTISFIAHESMNPFRLKRKADCARGGMPPVQDRTITRIERVNSVPVRCVGVDNKSHLFLAGDGWYVTSNTQHWLSGNDGHAMQQAIARNLAKSRDGSARELALTNAHDPGEDSVAAHDWDAFRAIEEGRSQATGFLYDSLEPAGDIDLSNREELREGLIIARGDSSWLDVDRLIEEVYDPTTPPSVSRRYYLNMLTVAEDSWIAPHEWAACAKPTEVLADKDIVTLGFDGGVNEDSTALVACSVQSGHLQLLGCWEKPELPGKVYWEVDRLAVDAAVRQAMATYQVAGFFCDPALWESYVDSWSSDFGARMQVKGTTARPLEFRMNRPTAVVTAVERFYQAVMSKTVSHDGSTVLTRHILNSKRRITKSGIVIAKDHPGSPRKIDAAYAAILAYEARSGALAGGLDLEPRRSRKLYRF